MSARVVQWAFRSYTAIVTPKVARADLTNEKVVLSPGGLLVYEHYIYAYKVQLVGQFSAHMSHYFTNTNRGDGERPNRLCIVTP